MFDYSMEHLFSYTATLDSNAEMIGPVPAGLRMNIYVTGGEVSGPRLQGKLRPVGADWLTIRTDGVCILDVRATIESHDGALIYVEYNGVADPGEDTYQRFLDGDPPEKLVIRAVPRVQTSHPDYLWLNRLQCVSIGEANMVDSVVSYDVYGLK
jgi:hypothetical protein